MDAPRRAHGRVLVAAAALLGCACGRGSAGDVPGAAKVAPENGGVRVAAEEDWSQVPVPAEDGPKLAPVVMKAPIYAKPDQQTQPVGYLRAGARVARSAEPVSRRDCPDGWYAIRPYGFVCVGPEATVKLDHPVARAMTREPDRSKAMPYPYAFVRAIAPNYMRVPTKAEQFQYEMRLERHLRNWEKLRAKWDDLDVGANDVPLDERGHGADQIPEHALPMDQSQRFGGDGKDEIPWWLVGERRIPNLSSFRAPPYAVIANRIKRHAGLALIGTFVAGPEAQHRRFAISADARLVPADKLKADSGSPFHGHSIRESGLPVAFARRAGATWWELREGRLARGERLGWREFIELTGTVKMLEGVRMVEARNGKWLRSEDLKVAAKPSKVPSWARGKRRWIEIGIVSQTLVLWEGDRPVYATLVSTGKDGLPVEGKKGYTTPLGTFNIYQKHVTTTMDSEESDHEFELRDVPWVMYFKGGYALHAAYWHDDFGRVRSHGCVNIAPIDARVIFEFSTPQVPAHWHAAYVAEATEPGTIVHIRP